MSIQTTAARYLFLLALASLSATLTAEPRAWPSVEKTTVAPTPAVIRHGSLQLGTYVETILTAETEDQARAFSALVEAEIDRLENVFSAHRDSPVSRLNAANGEACEIPTEVAEVLRRALDIAEETDGAFNPAIGPLARLWAIGFGGQRIPNDADIEKARHLTDYRKIRLQEVPGTPGGIPRHFVARLAPEQSIDLGGIAKGYIGKEVARLLKEKGLIRGLLNLGGDVFVIGDKAPGLPWSIGLQHPLRERGSYFAVIEAKDTAVVSSGGYERYFDQNNRRYSHIFDARTGRPALTDLSSVTVMDDDAVKADALATALFAMGREKAEAFLKKRPDLKVVMLKADLKSVLVTPAALSSVTLTTDEMQLTVLK